ncbi:MAG: hypothetical protein AAFX08_05965 [Pseudomonadota bacterium]
MKGEIATSQHREANGRGMGSRRLKQIVADLEIVELIPIGGLEKRWAGNRKPRLPKAKGFTVAGLKWRMTYQRNLAVL